MKQTKSLGTLTVAVLLASCVTINVYFPAAAADTAARTIVRDVLGEQVDVPAEQQPPPPDKGSHLHRQQKPWTQLLTGVINTLVTPARAQADINIDTPVITQLRASLKQRQPQLRPYFNTGALGLTRDGLVGARDVGAVPLKERNRFKKLIADENKDRNTLYKEIARANGQPAWEPDIRKTFARVWVEEAPKGVWYQSSAGKWQKK